MDEILQAVSNVGFPIVCCLLMYLEHKKELSAMRTAIDNNTRAIDNLQNLLTRGDSIE